MNHSPPSLFWSVPSSTAVHSADMSNYETGRREISLGKLAQVAALYGCGVERLLQLDGFAAGAIMPFPVENLSAENLELMVWARKLISGTARLDAILAASTHRRQSREASKR